MNREEFLRRLEYLLSDIPEEEKRDALDYYRDYLEDAGEREEEVLRGFGSPERVAAIIRSGVRGDRKESGEFTDTGYTDERFAEPGSRMVPEPAGGATDSGPRGRPRGGNPGERRTGGGPCAGSPGGQPTGGGPGAGNPGGQPPESGPCAGSPGGQPPESGPDGGNPGGQPAGGGSRRRGMPFWKTALLVLAILLLLPVILRAGGFAVKAAGALLAVLAVLLVLAAVLTLALMLAAGVSFFGGTGLLFSDFMTGLLMIGLGFLCLSLGLVALVLSVLFYGKLLPRLFNGLVDGMNRLLHRERRSA